jgi:hypothetical protein
MKRTAIGIAAALAAVTAVTPVAAQLAVRGTGVLSVVEHRVDAGSGVEQTSGMLYGAEGTLFLGSRIEIQVRGAAGKLTADSALAVDRDVAEGTVKASVLTVPWLALHAGLTARTYTTPLVRQRWTVLRFGGEARLGFVGDDITGVLRAEILPSVTVSGLERPNRAFAAGAGLEWRLGAILLGVNYDLERYDFPLIAGFERREQYSTLTVHAGLRLGSRRAP